MTAAEAEQFSEAMLDTFACWPNMASRVNDDMVAAWFGHLQDYQLNDVVAAFRKLGSSEEWAPPLCKVVNLVKIADSQRKLDQRIADAHERNLLALTEKAGQAPTPDVRAEHNARWQSSVERLLSQGMTMAEATMSLLTRTVTDVATSMDMANARRKAEPEEKSSEGEASLNKETVLN